MHLVHPEAAEQLVRKKILSNDSISRSGIAINPPIFHYFVLNETGTLSPDEEDPVSPLQAQPNTVDQASPLPDPSMTDEKYNSGHVFISYSRKDTEVLERIISGLMYAELPYWTDEHIEPGTDSWHMFIESAIESAGCMVVLMSPNSKSSIWVRKELEYAKAQDLPIIPLLISGDERTAVPFALMGSQHIDLRINSDEIFQQVLSAVRLRREETRKAKENELKRIQEEAKEL